MNIPPSSAALSAQLLQTSRLPGNATATAAQAGLSAELFGFQATQDARTLGIPPSRGESADDLRRQFLNCLCR